MANSVTLEAVGLLAVVVRTVARARRTPILIVLLLASMCLIGLIALAALAWIPPIWLELPPTWHSGQCGSLPTPC
jgi:CHASE2 domain-containing sensor protein